MEKKEAMQELLKRCSMNGMYWPEKILDRLATQEEVELLLTLPATLEEFAEKNGLDKAAATEKIKSMDIRGMCFPREKDGAVVWDNWRTPVHMLDATGFPLMDQKYDATPEQKEIIFMWDHWRQTEMYNLWGGLDAFVRQREKEGNYKFDDGQYRVVPVAGSVKNPLPEEDIEEFVRKAAKTHGIIINDCMCNYPMKLTGQTSGNNVTCMHFSEFETKYMRERGLGKEVSLKEALEMVHSYADQGLVCMPNGGKEWVGGICNCDTRACAVCRGIVRYGYQLMFKSRYQAISDPNKCTACGNCVKRCPFGAIVLEKDMAAFDIGKDVMKATVNPDKCYGCGVCVIKCAPKAMSLKVVRPPEYIHSGPSVNGLDPGNYFL